MRRREQWKSLLVVVVVVVKMGLELLKLKRWCLILKVCVIIYVLGVVRSGYRQHRRVQRMRE